MTKTKRRGKRWAVLTLSMTLFLTTCTSCGKTSEPQSDALVWNTWSSYEKFEPFLDLVKEKYPDIEIAFKSYKGANRTAYSWAQMRADDISDIFITSQILDEELAKERLADLSEYPFINDISTAVLDQAQIDGGLYLLPVSYSMYGIFYNKTLMEEKNWEVPTNFAQLEALCEEIEAEGMIPGVMATQLTGAPFSAVFNLAKTDWLSTPEGHAWERAFLDGDATAKGNWEDTMAYVQRYLDIGMLETDPEDRNHDVIVEDYLGNRKAVFCTAVHAISRNTAKGDGTGDELGIMPYISEDGSKNVYMYSPSFYFGISKRLTEPGNEKKLENAIHILSLLYSPEGQEALINNAATTLSMLDGAEVPEDSMIHDAQNAMREGRAFPMTYAHWEGVLADMGQAYKEWFRGENDMDGEGCIARMDDLQQTYLENLESFYFAQSSGNFTLEETAALVGQALGSGAGADAALVPIGEFHDGVETRAGVSGKLYQEKINSEIVSTICPAFDGEYAVMTMTGAQVQELEKAGFDAEGDGNPFPYLLVTKGDQKLGKDTAYQVAFLMNGYTEAVADAYGAQVYEESLKTFVGDYLKAQGSVAPGENYWK